MVFACEGQTQNEFFLWTDGRMDGQRTEVRFCFVKVMFFKKLNYRNLEIRVLHENSLRADLFSALYNVFFCFLKKTFFSKRVFRRPKAKYDLRQ